MTRPDSLELAAQARADGLDCVLVGGNAVNLYAYLRTTFDVDLLIREKDAGRWRAFLEERGYELFHATPNFTRMRFALDPTGALPIDLMLADAETFAKISGASQEREVAEGVRLPIPAPLHLIAMKLHALRSPHRVESGVDLQDVRHLIATKKIDTSSGEFRTLLDRYASESIRARILQDREELPPSS